MENLAHPSGTMTTEAPRRRQCRGNASGLLIAAIVAGFIVWWPVGLALLAWAIWRDQLKIPNAVSRSFSPTTHGRVSVPNFMNKRPDNLALAAYLEREQERLRAEQQKLDELISAFDSFKEAERRAADQRDFDSFLRQHATEDKSADSPESKPTN